MAAQASALNSTTVWPAGTWVGTWEDTNAYGRISFALATNRHGTFSGQWSHDGITTTHTDQFIILAGQPAHRRLPRKGQYFRAQFTPAPEVRLRADLAGAAPAIVLSTLLESPQAAGSTLSNILGQELTEFEVDGTAFSAPVNTTGRGKADFIVKSSGPLVVEVQGRAGDTWASLIGSHFTVLADVPAHFQAETALSQLRLKLTSTEPVNVWASAAVVA